MLQMSQKLVPDSNLSKVLALGSTSNIPEYNSAKKALQPELETLFPGRTIIELYFKDVLST